MIILGIDPGLANTGWGVVECAGNSYRCVSHGCVCTQAEEGTAPRLKAIHDRIALLIAQHRPDEAAIESIYFNVNVRTAFATGQARGAALLATADAGLPVGEYGPSEIKSAVVGSGTADKRQVGYMVRSILGMAEEPKPDHAADALAVAITHANLRVSRSRERGTRPGGALAAAISAAEAREARR